MPNIKFSYTYRDAGGSKKYGEVIFSTEHTIDINTTNSEIRRHLIDGEFFYPDQLAIPSIHFETYIAEIDHDWYFFEGIEITSESATDTRTFQEFLSQLKHFAKKPKNNFLIYGAG